MGAAQGAPAGTLSAVLNANARVYASPPQISMIRLFTRRCACAALLIVAAAHSLPAAPPGLPQKPAAELGFDPARLERVPAMLRREIAANRYAGAVWLIARDGAIASQGAIGVSDVTTGKPLTEDSVFRIFSMTKIVTSVTLLTLLEEGLISLEDPAERYVPALARVQVYVSGPPEAMKLEKPKSRITIRHLLTHTAGFYYDFSAPEPLKTMFNQAEFWHCATLQEAVEKLVALPLVQHPGTKWNYGTNTDVLGAVIEAVTGQDLETAMRERVFGPLGMRATTFAPGPELLARLATIHQRKQGGGLEPNEEWRIKGTLAFPSGGGGLYSTLHDYARFAQMLLQNGTLDGVRVLSRKSVELMLANQFAQLGTPTGPAPHTGLGVSVRREDREPWRSLGSTGAFGWTGAATTSVTMDPKERMLLIVLLQHVPYNEDLVFERFANTAYQALR